MKHVGVNSWFKRLSDVQPDFVPRERVVWVDIEGIPLCAWSNATFHRIGSRWGEVLNLNDSCGEFCTRKRLCIMTKQEDNILEKFKIIVKRKVFVVRAKELFVWTPNFVMPDSVTDDELNKEDIEVHVDSYRQSPAEEECDNDHVSDTLFGDNNDDLINNEDVASTRAEPDKENSVQKEVSSDPFNIYDLLHKHNKDVNTDGISSSIPFPPGYTPENVRSHVDVQEVQEDPMSRLIIQGSNSQAVESSQYEEGQFRPKLHGRHGSGINNNEGGSVLALLEDMINVGKTMGFKYQDPRPKELDQELCNKHKISFLSIQETKFDKVSDSEVRSFWGNSIFEFIISDAIGNSGVNKLKSRLSTWKLKTLSIGGRLTLIKSVLGSTPIYNMSIYKVPKAVLCVMESIRRNFFNGIREGERTCLVKWSKVLLLNRRQPIVVDSSPVNVFSRKLLAMRYERITCNQDDIAALRAFKE
ncbi:hypothetical protein Tco_1017020 [Tanacetum coccineum]|uniref:DUF4283 domain-containing protein n=1 Tax=Tanacetum coccineum TaxID=301880 RepID=A0ABQ5FQA2_9ASTR